MKLLIIVMLTIGGFIGSWLGGLLDSGNAFGMWSMLLGLFVGPLLGIFVGYKVGKQFLE